MNEDEKWTNEEQKSKHATLREVLSSIWEALRLLAGILQKVLPQPRSTIRTVAINSGGSQQKSLPAPKKAKREEDRNLDLERGWDPARRERWGTLFATCAFAAGVVGGAGFVYAYWTARGNSFMGGMLALSLAGFGSAMVVYAHWLIPHKEVTELRETLPSSPEEREAVLRDVCSGAHDVRRRGLILWIGAACAAMVGGVVISLLRGLGIPPGSTLFKTVWKRGQRLMTVDGKPVALDALRPGDTVTVFPEDSIGEERSQTVLIRVKEDLLQLPSDRKDWAPQGYIAYSRVCTHAGCPVALFETTTNLLLCPCHQSTFDVLRAATPTGGPAARPLPQLPLYADGDGTLRAGGGFSEPPGPGFWGMP